MTHLYKAKIERSTILSSILLLIISFSSATAQHKISTNDEQNIKRKALTLISRLNDKYNQLLDSDSYDRNALIENMTLPQTDGAISDFVSDQVIIEDDFNTIQQLNPSLRDKKVDVYFKDIGLYYGRQDNGAFFNENKKIIFSNITSSKLMAISEQEPIFLHIYFQLKYDGIDSRTKKQFTQPNNRIAEMQATKQSGVWQVAIKSIRFFDAQKPPTDYSKNVIIEKSSKVEIETVVIEENLEKKIIYRTPILQAFKKNEKWGIRNVDDDKILIEPTFDEIEDFSSEGVALVNTDGLWGFIDSTGQIIIKCEYDYAESFSKEKKGRAKVQKGIEIYFIDTSGNKVK